MLKKVISILIVCFMATGLFAGCGGGGGGTPAPQSPSNNEPAAPPQLEVDATDGPIHIVFWFALGARLGEAVERMVDDYNKSQDKVFVEAQFQGTYDDAITKLRATPPGQGPDIMQMYDIGTRWMIDSGYALTMQDFIDHDNYDISDYEPNILAYYTLDGTLYSMPYNCSSPVIMYNKTVLDAAGLDAATAFKDLDACYETAQALHANGVRVGGSFTNWSWVFEQLISRQDQQMLDNGNGREGKATRLIIDENGAGMNLLNQWKRFADAPFSETYGKNVTESRQQFTGGNVGFVFDSSASYSQMVDASDFELGFAPLPAVNAGDNGGTSVGGASLWIMDNGDANKAAAAWDFIKYTTDATVQANFCIDTGYIPVRISSSELPQYVDYVTNVNPGILVAINSLRDSKPSNAGGVMAVFPQARVIIENEIETMVNDSSVTAESVLDAIVAQVNAEIDMYNRTNP